ncbi:hypothetical protein AAMO2058_001268600 [Amorphochlora amoebiformis]
MDKKTRELFELLQYKKGKKEREREAKEIAQGVKDMLDKDAYLLRSADRRFATILHRAVELQNFELVATLLQIDASLYDDTDSVGWNAMHFFINGCTNEQTVSREGFEWFQAVCKTKSNPFYPIILQGDAKGTTPLMYLCSKYIQYEKQPGEEENEEEEKDESKDDDDDDAEDMERKDKEKQEYTHYDVLEVIVGVYKEEGNIFASNALGETALGIAQNRGEKALIALLKAMRKYKLDEELHVIKKEKMKKITRGSMDNVTRNPTALARGTCSGCVIA